MIRRTVLGLLGVWLTLTGTAMAGDASAAAQRLDRFRQLAASRLAAAELWGQAPSDEVLREIYALLDDEIVESLQMGGFFASQGFLQDRLDAFNEAWGGTALRISTLPGSDLTVGAFQLSPNGRGNSVRIYGWHGGAGLLWVIHREGIPVLQEMPTTGRGDQQFLVAWVGPESSRGNTSLRLELWRRQGESVRLAWSTDALPEGELLVSRFSLGGGQLSFHYEVRYPGWKPGCDGQTEQEDLYRYIPARETFVLARRQVHNGWHREFQADLARFLAALNAKDNQALAGLVADETLRRSLPTHLEADLACDEADGPSPKSVSVAAVSPAATRPGDPGRGPTAQAWAPGSGGGRPWTLVFRRTREGWRLASAVQLEPVSARIIR